MVDLEIIFLLQDTLTTVVDTTQNISSSSTSWITTLDSLSSVILNIATAGGIIYGLIEGGKKLEKYLKSEYIKKKFDRINRQNLETGEVAQNAINVVRGMYDPDNNILTADQLDKLQEITRNIENTSKGASNRVSTLSYFLSQTLSNFTYDDITLNNLHKNVDPVRLEKVIPFNYSFFRLIKNCCQEIHLSANNIVDIPESNEEESLSKIKPAIKQYLDLNNDSSIKGYSVGINYNPNSEYSFTFADILRRSCNIPLLYKSFYQVLGANFPVIHYMNYLNIYFPPKLSIRGEKSTLIDGLFGMELSLIGIERRTRSALDGTPTKNIIRFTYANLDKGFTFVDTTIKSEHDLTKEYYDSFLGSEEWHQDWITKFRRLGNEIIRFECEEDKVKQFYKEVRDSFVNNLEELSN